MNATLRAVIRMSRSVVAAILVISEGYWGMVAAASRSALSIGPILEGYAARWGHYWHCPLDALLQPRGTLSGRQELPRTQHPFLEIL
jgi:hypothetical protein